MGRQEALSWSFGELLPTVASLLFWAQTAGAGASSPTAPAASPCTVLSFLPFCSFPPSSPQLQLYLWSGLSPSHDEGAWKTWSTKDCRSLQKKL